MASGLKVPLLFALLVPFLFCYPQFYDCGCYFNWENLADCSNQTNIDFKCLSEKAPNGILLRSNMFTEFPSELLANNFNETQYLDVSDNRIEHMPENLLDHLPGLQVANFSYNNLTNPKEILGIDGVLRFSIDHNPYNCDCTDPEIHLLLKQAKELNTIIWCNSYNTTDKSIVPLDSYCYFELNSLQEPKGNTGIIWVYILAAIYFVFFCVVFYCR